MGAPRNARDGIRLLQQRLDAALQQSVDTRSQIFRLASAVNQQALMAGPDSAAAGRDQLQAAVASYRGLRQDVAQTQAQLHEYSRANADQARAIGRENISAVQSFFQQHGIGPDQGNGAVRIESWDKPGLTNAYFRPSTESLAFGRSQNGVPYAMSLDVAAHEYTHRVLHNMVPGISQARDPQTMAINESLADTIAMAVDQADWWVGEDAATTAIRRLDQGGVTINDFTGTSPHRDAAIPNAAAYRIGQAVGRDKLGAIYVRAMGQYLTPQTRFSDLAIATERSARDIFGNDSAEVRAVQQAWLSVLRPGTGAARGATGGAPRGAAGAGASAGATGAPTSAATGAGELPGRRIPGRRIP